MSQQPMDDPSIGISRQGSKHTHTHTHASKEFKEKNTHILGKKWKLKRNKIIVQELNAIQPERRFH